MNNMSKEELELEKKRRKYKFDKANVISQLGGDTEDLEPEVLKICDKYTNLEITFEEWDKEMKGYIKSLFPNYEG